MTGSLNRGVRFDLVLSVFFEFHVPGPMEFDKNHFYSIHHLATWPKGSMFVDKYFPFLLDKFVHNHIILQSEYRGYKKVIDHLLVCQIGTSKGSERNKTK